MRTRRLLAAFAVAALCAPGTWVRSPVDARLPQTIAITSVAGVRTGVAPGWDVAGVWHLRAPGLRFGGFSALLALDPDNLRAFTDRGFHLTLTAPDLAGADGRMNRQPTVAGREFDLLDIESATRDPVSGHYWVGYEQIHAIQRHTITSEASGVRDLEQLVDWPSNGGIEAMARLADGQFVVLPEARPTGLIFADDPVKGGRPTTFRFRSPARDFVPTDMAQLPDGRLIVLMRKVVWPSEEAWPPFASLVAIGDVPAPGGSFAPRIALDLGRTIPFENYEGLAVRPRKDGRVDVWIISDDNFSVFQRTLLAKLVLDPRAL
jgi:hypothetical protein